jgi:hypothetical protein
VALQRSLVEAARDLVTAHDAALQDWGADYDPDVVASPLVVLDAAVEALRRSWASPVHDVVPVFLRTAVDADGRPVDEME